jgi:hypothetical protein
MTAPSFIAENHAAMELVLLAVGSVVVVNDLILVPRTIGAFRAVKRDAGGFRERWRGLEATRRRRLTAAIRRGDAAIDPADTPLALEAIGNSERLLEAIRLSYFGYVPTTLFVVLIGLADHDRGVTAVGAGLTAFAVVGAFSIRRRKRKLRATATAIRARGAAR